MTTTEETPQTADTAAKPTKMEEDKDEKPSMTEEDTIAAVAERLQFFFSDANVRQDTFIRRLLLSPDKKVMIDQLLKFNTIKQYTTDVEMVKKAAGKLGDVLTVTEDDAIARVTEFTTDLMDKNLPVSLVVGNLPVKEEEGQKKYGVTVDDMKKIFEPYGPIALIKLRFGFSNDGDRDLLGSPPTGQKRKGPRIPLGSALVEFEQVDALEKAAAETLTKKDGEDVKPSKALKIGEDNELTIMLLKEFVQAGKKRRREAPEHEDKGEDEKEKGNDAEGKKFEIEWKPGCVIMIEGLSETCDREQMLEAVAKGLDKDIEAVKEMKVYVDYSRGQTDGCLRFNEPDHVPDFLAKLQSGEVEVAGAKVTKATLLKGDVEKQYWDDFMAFKTRQLRQREEEKKSKSKGRRHKKYRR